MAELTENDEKLTFKQLGVIDEICDACQKMGYKYPTPIQEQTIPLAIEGRDIIGLAQTGSGKTAAFAIPIIQSLWKDPSTFYAVIMAPTRELAYQISEQFEALGGGIGIRSVVIVGGMDMVQQAIALNKKPHIIVCTPGRLHDHLENTKGFNLKNLKYLVLDEADRLLDLDFGPIIDKILRVIPIQRKTMLFSATMTSKVEKLQRASLVRPVKIAVSSKYETVSTLMQYYSFLPFKFKETYLSFLVQQNVGQSMIIFTRTCNDAERITLLLRHIGRHAIALHGQMNQSARLGSLNKFKSGSRSILVATDVAARGLDIPLVDLVINYDIPTDSKAYIHRVGRTARAGRSGKSIALVTQYDLELYLRIEAALGKKLEEYKLDKEEVMAIHEKVGEANRAAIIEMKERHEKQQKKQKKFSKKRSHDDEGL